MVLDFDSKFQKVKWLVINHSYKSALVDLVSSYKLQEKFKRYLLSSTDSDLEAFSHNPTDGSFAPLPYIIFRMVYEKIPTMKTTQQPLNARGLSE